MTLRLSFYWTTWEIAPRFSIDLRTIQVLAFNIADRLTFPFVCSHSESKPSYAGYSALGVDSFEVDRRENRKVPTYCVIYTSKGPFDQGATAIYTALFRSLVNNIVKKIRDVIEKDTGKVNCLEYLLEKCIQFLSWYNFQY